METSPIRDAKGRYISGHAQSNTGRSHIKKGEVRGIVKEKTEKKCIVCNSLFYVLPSRIHINHCSRKCSDVTSKKNRSGEKNYRWKGGISPDNVKIRNSIECVLWRNSVFSRDNFTCQKCGARGGKINAHHIKKFSTHPELRTAIDNGITLCVECHKEEHKRKK